MHTTELLRKAFRWTRHEHTLLSRTPKLLRTAFQWTRHEYALAGLAFR
jgi:hypothetical protein